MGAGEFLRQGPEFARGSRVFSRGLPVLVTNDFPQELLAKYKVKAVLTDAFAITPEEYAKGIESCQRLGT